MNATDIQCDRTQKMSASMLAKYYFIDQFQQRYYVKRKVRKECAENVREGKWVNPQLPSLVTQMVGINDPYEQG